MYNNVGSVDGIKHPAKIFFNHIDGFVARMRQIGARQRLTMYDERIVQHVNSAIPLLWIHVQHLLHHILGQRRNGRPIAGCKVQSRFTDAFENAVRCVGRSCCEGGVSVGRLIVKQFELIKLIDFEKKIHQWIKNKKSFFCLFLLPCKHGVK